MGELEVLLRMFGSQVPAVVKRRARELLDVVKDAVRRGLEGGGNGSGSGSGEKEGEGSGEKEVRREDSEEGVGQVGKRQVEQEVVKDTTQMLWGSWFICLMSSSNTHYTHYTGTDKTSEMIKVSSSLFGKPPPPKTASVPTASTSQKTYTMARSTLFGNIKNVKAPATGQVQMGRSGFQELVKRINNTLVIAPSVPKVRPRHLLF